MKTAIVLILSALFCCVGETVSKTYLPPGWKLQRAGSEWRWVDAKGMSWLSLSSREKAIENAWKHYNYKEPDWKDCTTDGFDITRVRVATPIIFTNGFPTTSLEFTCISNEPQYLKINLSCSTNWTGVNSGTNELGYVVTNHIANIEYQGSNYTFQLKSVPTDKAVWREKETIGYATNITVQPWLEFTNNIHWRAL